MRKLNTFQETAETGRVVLDLGDGTVLDTDNLGGGGSVTVTEDPAVPGTALIGE